MLKWPAFDPDETKDYARDWTPQMDADGDTIADAEFAIVTLNSGLGVVSSSIDATGKIAVVWFSADDKPTLSALAGTTILVDHTISTTPGGRTYNETIGLPIKIK